MRSPATSFLRSHERSFEVPARLSEQLSERRQISQYRIRYGQRLVAMHDEQRAVSAGVGTDPRLLRPHARGLDGLLARASHRITLVEALFDLGWEAFIRSDCACEVVADFRGQIFGERFVVLFLVVGDGHDGLAVGVAHALERAAGGWGCVLGSGIQSFL